MSNTVKRMTVYFIDEHNGLNNGYYVNSIKQILRKAGVIVSDKYYSGVTNFIYCILPPLQRTAHSTINMNDPEVINYQKSVLYHMQLLRDAINNKMIISSIEHILEPHCVYSLITRIAIIVDNYRIQYGSSFLMSVSNTKESCPLSSFNGIRVCDLTNHYKPVILDITSYRPPHFDKDVVAGLSPFIPSTLWKQMSEELKSKYKHLRDDAITRMKGHVPAGNWRELYIKRSVRKKHTKTRTCELCRMSFNNYPEHVSTLQHIQNIHSPHYFEVLRKVFNRYLQTSWKCLLNDYNKAQKQKSAASKQVHPTIASLESHFNVYAFFTQEPEPTPLSPMLSSLSTEMNDYSDRSTDTLPHTHEEPTILSQCVITSNDTSTWLFPQFFEYTQTRTKAFAPATASSPVVRTPPRTRQRTSKPAKHPHKTKPSPPNVLLYNPDTPAGLYPISSYPPVTSASSYSKELMPMQTMGYSQFQGVIPILSPCQNVQTETPFQIIPQEPHITLEPYSYPRVMSMHCPSMVPSVIPGYSMCEKAETVALPILQSNRGVMAMGEKEKRVPGEVELIHTNSSSVAAALSPVSELMHCLSPCIDKSTCDVKKKEA